MQCFDCKEMNSFHLRKSRQIRDLQIFDFLFSKKKMPNQMGDGPNAHMETITIFEIDINSVVAALDITMEELEQNGLLIDLNGAQNVIIIFNY